jgi:serine-type D-Ala-D-Ala carboxypeptidase (penicillin-binding protein 5/6)
MNLEGGFFMPRKILASCISVLLVFSIYISGAFAMKAPPATQPNMNIDAKSYILVDQITGQVILENKADDKLPLASVVKVMSLILICDAVESGKISLDEKVSISRNAAGAPGTQAFLDANADYTVSDLIRTVVIASANDSSVALAEKINGSEEVFVQEMNKKAQELGMTNSKFTDCTGLSSDQYSTARDMATASRELCRKQTAFRWGSIFTDQIVHSDGRVTELTNPNRMVRFYDGCDGLRTGSSPEAGYCIAATAKRGQQRLIAVILGAPNSDSRFESSRKLLDYGFSSFSLVLAAKKGEVVKKDIPVNGGDVKKVNAVAENDAGLLVLKGSEKGVAKKVNIPETLDAPIKKGQVIGEMIITIDGEEKARINLVADNDAKTSDYWDSFASLLTHWACGK